jgi:hypothetical protein
MLNQFAFANSLAILTGGLYVLFGVLALVLPRAFQVLFNSQFFGLTWPRCSGRRRRQSRLS